MFQIEIVSKVCHLLKHYFEFTPSEMEKHIMKGEY